MQLIPFDSMKTPVRTTSLFKLSKDLSGGVGSGGFPHVSVKGKVFHITRGDEKTLVTKPGEDEPASSIEVVIVAANEHLSKVFYSGGYTEGSKEAPSCYSNDGISPATDAKEPQSKKCAACAHNQWGARITDSGSKGKACSDSRRIAISVSDQINDPMLLRVPAASLKALAVYNDILTKRGVAYQEVVTKIGFDYTVAHPALTFKAVGFMDDATCARVLETSQTDTVSSIIGTAAPRGGFISNSDDEEFVPVAKISAPAAAPSAKKTAPVNELTEVEQVAAAPAKAPAVKSPVIEVASYDEMMSELNGMLGDD
jgi:hypothetical protein